MVAGEVVDELDDELGQVVRRRRLAGEEERPRRHLEARVLPQPVVEHDDAQRVEQLPLVLVDALDLAVEDRVRDPPSAPRSIGASRRSADLAARLAARNASRKPASSASGLSLASSAEVGDPAVADGLGDDAGERRVRQQQPAPRRDAVGLVAEALGEHLGQVLHRGRAQQRGVDRGHAVRAVRADDGEVGHADVLGRAFLDQAHARDAALVAGEAAPDVVEQAAVDLEDDLEVARQQHLEPRERPFLERLGQQRVVRVRERPLGEVPGLVPSEVRLVEQDPHQLGDGHGRVRVVELDGDLLGKRAPVGVAAAEAADRDRPASRRRESTPARTAALAPGSWSRRDRAPA